MTTPSPGTPVRAFGIVLAVPQTVIGVWASLSPRGWFDNFPGLGPALVAAEPPYNQHLVTDAGAGFLAIGLLLLGACVFGGAAEIRMAAIAHLILSVPHLSTTPRIPRRCSRPSTTSSTWSCSAPKWQPDWS